MALKIKLVAFHGMHCFADVGKPINLHIWEVDGRRFRRTFTQFGISIEPAKDGSEGTMVLKVSGPSVPEAGCIANLFNRDNLLKYANNVCSNSAGKSPSQKHYTQHE